MTFGIARSGGMGTTFDDPPNGAVRAFCQQRRMQKDSQCLAHYQQLWAKHDPNGTIERLRCPYGLVTTSAMGGRKAPVALTSFWISGLGDSLLPATVLDSALIPETDLRNVCTAFAAVSQGVRDEELDHFEAALHDTRHLNHAITQNAEAMLANLGWKQDTVWDMQQLQRDEMSRRALTIYAASRDLSQSILMHEISRNPAQAGSDVTTLHIHKLFYRQHRIGTDRMHSAGVTCSLGTSDKSLRLSSAFRLIPKILLDNAFKYSQRGTEVRVLFYDSPQFYIIECRNRGAIVREDEVERLFERGVRGSNKSGVQGQGIGLWLAKTIVEANRGRIELSVLNGGPDYSGRRIGETIVRITLPQ